MHLVVSGSHGLIGTALTERLRVAGHRVTALVRGAASSDQIAWDPARAFIDKASLEGTDAVVHLGGVGIADKRWNDNVKRSIRDSRTHGTAVLSEALATLDRPPSALLSASAIGFYGNRGDEVLDEMSPAGTGFLSEVCTQWERATGIATQSGIRTVHLRTGIVLSVHGGALRKQLPLFKLGLGGRFGNGRQWQSWISITDHVSAVMHLLTSSVSGPVNLTAPTPVTNADFTRTLGHALRRPTVFPVPKFGPRLLLGRELADTLLFESQRVLPKALESDGFGFAHQTLDVALRAELEQSSDR
jgi:uncharacterized protein